MIWHSSFAIPGKTPSRRAQSVSLCSRRRGSRRGQSITPWPSGRFSHLPSPLNTPSFTCSTQICLPKQESARSKISICASGRGGFGRDEVRRIEDDAQIGTADICNQAAGEFRRVERMQRDGFNAHERMHLFGVCADLAGEIQQAGIGGFTLGFGKGEMGRLRADAARAEDDAGGTGTLNAPLLSANTIGISRSCWR